MGTSRIRPDLVKPSFVIFDIWASECPDAEITNAVCTHMLAVGVLTVTVCNQTYFM